MESTRPLFLMLSRTGTYIGKAIRLFTHYEYNHVSLSLDPELRNWVSFARYARGVPLAGGFVPESPERYFSSGGPVQVKIFRIDIPVDRYMKLQTLFAKAELPSSGLIYNTFGALASPAGIHFSVPGAYTCLEFADTVLGESHESIQELEAAHREELIYEGALQDLVPDTGNRSGRFFLRRGILRGTMDTIWHFARLCRRTACHNRQDIVSTTLQ